MGRGSRWTTTMAPMEMTLMRTDDEGFKRVEQGREEVGQEAATVGVLGFRGLTVDDGLGWEGWVWVWVWV